MTEVITDKKEIDKIIADKIKGKEIIFTQYYRIGIAQKGISHEKVIQIFPQFEKVIAIEKDILKHGNMGYELFYELSSNTSFSIATIPNDKNILIIHTVEYKRDLSHRFKQK